MNVNPNSIGEGLSKTSFMFEHLDRNGLNRHVFDNVRTRVDALKQRVISVCNHLQSVNDPAASQRSALLERIDAIIPQNILGRPEQGMQQQQLTKAAWLVGHSIDAGSHINRSSLSYRNGGMQQIDQVALHVGYNVRALEQEYGAIESQIGQLENAVRARNNGTMPTELGDTHAQVVLKERHAKLQAQINGQDRLQSVHTDGISLQHGPNGSIGQVSAPIQYDVRLPANTGITLTVGGRAFGGVDIPLSGGAKWVRFPTQLIDSLIPRGGQNPNLRVRLTQPDVEGTVIREPVHGNMIFNFNGVPPPVQAQPQSSAQPTPIQEPQRRPVIRTSSITDAEERQKTNVEVQRNNIEVRPISPMYTGDERQFMIRSMGLRGETDRQAARDTRVTFNGVQLAIPPAVPNEATNPIGIRVRRLADGRVTVTSTSDLGAVTNIRFQRPGFPPIDRNIEVRTIGVTPVADQTLVRADAHGAVEYSITTADGSDQNSRTTVTVDSETRVVRMGDGNTQIGGLMIERRENRVIVRLSPDAGEKHDVIFRHGNQEMTRRILVTSGATSPEPNPTAPEPAPTQPHPTDLPPGTEPRPTPPPSESNPVPVPPPVPGPSVSDEDLNRILNTGRPIGVIPRQ